MANEKPDGDAGQWERVASELQACRAAQQRTWGDIDNLTLGRYLSGEVDGDERRQVEQALDSLPELRKLTDLVRDVLGDLGPAEPTPAPQREAAAAPAVLPFRPRAAPRPPQRSRLRRYAALAAAACLLLALGVALPRLAAPTAPADRMALAEPEHGSASLLPAEVELARLADRADDLQGRGQYRESLGPVVKAEKLLARTATPPQPQAAASWNRLGLAAQKAGDLERSEKLLQYVYTTCRKPNANGDARAREAGVYLANAYEFALNAEPNLPGAPGAADGGLAYPLSFFAGSYAFSSPYGPPNPYADLNPYHDGRRTIEYEERFEKTMVKAKGAYVSPRSSTPEQTEWKEQQAARSARALRERITRQDSAETRKVVVPALLDAIQSPFTPAPDRVRYIYALGRLGPAARDAAPVLAERFRRAAPADRKAPSLEAAEQRAVVLTLGQLGDDGSECKAVLNEALKSDQPEVRAAAEITRDRLQKAEKK
jgi:hypothetical protein